MRLQLRALGVAAVALAATAFPAGCKDDSASSKYSIELTPAIVERDENQRFEVTLTVTSDTGNYDGADVKLDVVQEEVLVIDELTQADVPGVLESFEAIDPEGTGLGTTWKRIKWDASGDAARRQQRLSWTCGSGVARVYFFVEVAGKPVRAPSGATWAVAEPWGQLDPNTADIIERELELEPSTELEVLPIGCGEDAPPPPPPPQPPVDAGPPSDGGGGEGEIVEIGGGSFEQYGLSEAGTLYFVLDGRLYWREPASEPVLIDEGAAIEAAQGEAGPYAYSELKVTPGGAAIVRVGGSTTDCVLMAQGTAWDRVMCLGDDVDGITLDRLAVYAGQGRAVDAENWGAEVVGRGQSDSLPAGGSFFNVEVFDGGTPLQQFLVGLVETVFELPDLEDSVDPRLVSVVDSPILGPKPGIRGRAIDGTVALYSRPLPVLAWADLNQTGGPIGDPPPPSNVYAAGYSFDNQPLGGLTVNRDGTLAYLVKYVDVDGELLAPSGIYIDPGLAPSQLLDLSVGLPLDGSNRIIADFGELPAIQYQLVEGDVAIINAKVLVGTDVVGGIWRADGDGPVLLFKEGDEAPGRTPDTLLGAGISVDLIGAMVVNPVGVVAFSARLAGSGVDGSNNGAIYTINDAGEVVLLVRTGDPVTIDGVEHGIDILDMASGGVPVPPVAPIGSAVAPPEFHGTGARDIHVAHGSGSDGHNSTFTSEGCGRIVYRAGNFAATQHDVLRVVSLPCP